MIDLNIIQIENSRDSFDRTLQNTNRLYSGNYTQTTVDIAAKENPRQPKVLGQPYNFEWEGDFLDKFVLNINNETISLNSKGTGTGGKALFFEGYDFIFGLTDESLKEVVNEKLLPFFLEYFYNELT